MPGPDAEQRPLARAAGSEHHRSAGHDDTAPVSHDRGTCRQCDPGFHGHVDVSYEWYRWARTYRPTYIRRRAA